MQDRCSACHSTALIESARGTADEWQMLVDRMINFGAQLSPQEEQVLVQYLAQTYHPQDLWSYPQLPSIRPLAFGPKVLYNKN